MRTSQAGTSVLAALVFVAIFVLFISGYKVASQTTGSQSAAVATTLGQKNVTCTSGGVYTVDVETGAGNVESVTCSTGSERPECAHAVPGKCAVRYCPPPSYVTESGTCFVVSTCDPASDTTCLKSAIQNASQPGQAANIIAAQLLADRGETDALAPGYSGPIALADKLTERGRSAVALVIDETAEAASANNMDAAAIRDVAHSLKEGHAARPTSGPVAQISCQPKIAESGMKVGIAFGCANANTSEGGGFDTGGRLWGATEEELPSDLPNGTMIYGIACADEKRAASATCSVAVMKPFMLLTGELSDGIGSVAWVTRGMDVCDISAPGNTELSATFENPVPQSGVLTVPAVTADTEIGLTCTTVGGVVKQLTTTLRVR
jgi:hypothetical protein